MTLDKMKDPDLYDQRLTQTALDIAAGASKAVNMIPIGDSFGHVEGTDLIYEGRVVGQVTGQEYDEIEIHITDPEVSKIFGKPIDKVIGHRWHPDQYWVEREPVQGTSPNSTECDVCWGTGYVKGAGASCSEGCKPPT